jgi:putative RecB family exonuclease
MSEWTPVPVPILSPSAVNTFGNCPLQFKYQKIDKRYGPGSEATVRGSFVHEILEFLFKKPAEERTLETARVIARELWDTSVNKFSRKTWPEQVAAVDVTDISAFMHQAWWNVETYFEMEDPTTFEPVGLETWVNGEILGVKMRGIIDRLDYTDDGEELVIVDYKTGKSHKKGNRYEASKILPLMIYAELVEEEHKKSVAHMDLLFVSDGTTVSYEPNAANREAMYETIDTTNKALIVACETGVFPANKSKLCDWCDFKAECPAWA